MMSLIGFIKAFNISAKSEAQSYQSARVFLKLSEQNKDFGIDKILINEINLLAKSTISTQDNSRKVVVPLDKTDVTTKGNAHPSSFKKLL